MYKYAQIIDNKVYWIIENEMTLDELYAHKFHSSIKFVDITGRNDIKEGWEFIGGTFSEPPEINIEEILLKEIRIKRNSYKKKFVTIFL